MLVLLARSFRVYYIKYGYINQFYVLVNLVIFVISLFREKLSKFK